jgi:hypothetical protein
VAELLAAVPAGALAAAGLTGDRALRITMAFLIRSSRR